jgi:hypothetical protein
LSHTPPNRGIVVLGVARSGTSTIARSLNVFGVDTGSRLRAGGREKNPRGFFEDEAVLSINRRLRSLVVAPHGVSLWPVDALQRPEVQRLQDEAVRAIDSGFGASPLWGLKINGILRFFPFWQAVFERLGADIAFVVAVRAPVSAVKSRRRHRVSKPFRPERSLELDLYEWLASIVPHFGRLRGARFVVVDYDRMMEGPARELERMAMTLGLPLPTTRPDQLAAFTEGFLSRQLRHFPGSGDDRAAEEPVPQLVIDAWQWLHRLATDEVSAADQMLWQAWRILAAQLQAVAPLLSHIDQLEKSRRRAQLNPVSPVAFFWQGTRRWWRSRRH